MPIAPVAVPFWNVSFYPKLLSNTESSCHNVSLYPPISLGLTQTISSFPMTVPYFFHLITMTRNLYCLPNLTMSSVVFLFVAFFANPDSSWLISLWVGSPVTLVTGSTVSLATMSSLTVNVGQVCGLVF